jgi:hypothetical protein
VPNIVVSLVQEMARVHALIPRLDAVRRHEADSALRAAEDCLRAGSLEGMNQSLDDLQEFAEPKK